MKIIICAAGDSKRMGKLTKNLPKCLLPLGNKTILTNLLNNLDRSPVKEIIVITGFLDNKIRRTLKNYPKKTKITYVVNKAFSTTNNMYSIYLAHKEINGPMIFAPADLYVSREISSDFIDKSPSNSIVIDNDPKYFNLSDPVKVTIKDNQIIDIDKKLSKKDISGVAIGIYKLSPKAAKSFMNISKEYINKGSLLYGYIEPIKELLSKFKFKPFYTKGNFWYDVDTPEDYRAVRNKLSIRN